MTLKTLMRKAGRGLLLQAGMETYTIAIDAKLLAAAKIAIAEAERVGQGRRDAGLFKREQAMRMLSNMMPAVPEHDCANAVQVALDIVKRGNA